MSSTPFTVVTLSRFNPTLNELEYHFTSDDGKLKEWWRLRDIEHPLMVTLRICYDLYKTHIHFSGLDDEFYRVHDFKSIPIDLTRVMEYQRTLRESMKPGKMLLAPSIFHTPEKKRVVRQVPSAPKKQIAFALRHHSFDF